MGLPSKKRPKSEKRKRGFASRLKKINFSTCPRCQRSILSHRVCPFCGTYGDREVIKIKLKKEKQKTEKKEEGQEK